MTYDVYMHFPVLAIMTLFVSAFLVTLAGKREKLRNVIAGAAVLIALALLALLIKPVMVDGETALLFMNSSRLMASVTHLPSLEPESS